MLAWLVLAGGLAVAPALGQGEGQATVSSPHQTGVELSASVQQSLQQIQGLWLQWNNSGSKERSRQVIDSLLTTTRQLGMRHLPDLSLGALVQAEKAARQKDFKHARWALEAADRLDSGRPEVAFATADVDRLEGSYPSSLFHVTLGYLRLLGLPLERYLLGQSFLVWISSVLLLTGGLFIAIQMATKGGALFRDLTRMLAGRLPGSAGMVAAIVILVWPIVLPYGPVWLLLYWSVLFWGYASTSDRVITVSLWLLLGVAPVLISAQRRQLELNLSPPVQAMESISEKRLYGGLFTDLGVLRSLLPDSPAVKQLLADFHRSLNQWDLARSLYRQVLEKEPNNTAVLLNLGDYFFFKGDFGNAVQHYQKAATADPTSAAAEFNLSQAYSESYLFDEQKRALEQARALDDSRVDDWLKHTDQQRVVAPDGGLARVGEIRAQLLQSFEGRSAGSRRFELLRYGLSTIFALALLLVAVALHLARRPFGYTEPPFDVRLGSSPFDRWRRILVPGVAAAEAGEGGRTFLALLVPAVLLMLPLSGEIGYRLPWGYDPGNLIPWTIALLGLLLYFGVRLRWELTHQV